MDSSNADLSLTRLPPKAARLCLSVERSMYALGLGRPLRLLLALSGGVDSTALACIFAILAARRHDTLFAATLNHGLRREACQEVQGCLTLCQKLGITCKALTCDVASWAQQHKEGLEEAARTIRYRLLEETRSAFDADFVVTAHHADDLNEDILMRLVRGCGWPALGGMSARDDQRHLLRPLLGLKKKALTDFVRALHLSWFEDSSNNDLRFTRNRFRHKLLPLLEQENPHISKAFGNLHTLAKVDTHFWETYLTQALERFGYELHLDEQSISISYTKALLDALHPAARLRLYLRTLTLISEKRRTLGHQSGEAKASQLFALEDCVQRGKGGKTILFPGRISVIFQHKRLCFSAQL